MFLLLLACAEPEPTVDLLVELSSPGPYAVGYREELLTYDAPGGARSLRLAVWYPSEDTSGRDAEYLGAIEAPGVWDDAGVAEGAFPVVVFSHGHRGFAENSGFLMQHLASHGWVVAAPDHTSDTTLDPDDRHTDIYYLRPLDISAVIDGVLDGSASTPLQGHVREPVVAVGHSFGGYTLHALAGARYDLDTLVPGCTDGTANPNFCTDLDEAALARFQAGFRDERIAAFVPMAAGDYSLFGAGLAAAEGPMLMMTGTLDPNTDSPAIWEGLRAADRAHVQIQGGGHQTFTDFSGILEHAEGLIDAETGFDIIRPYVLAQARVADGDADAGALLNGSRVVSPLAVLVP